MVIPREILIYYNIAIIFDFSNQLEIYFQAGFSAAPTRAISSLKSINLPQQIKDIKLPDLPQAIKDLKM